MTTSTQAARHLVQGLVDAGVQHVVLCPGSRSAPLAYALAAADGAGALRVHVRVDERSAAFLALGVGKATGVPAAVATTSGTAVVNCHPAVLEAHHAHVPLVVLAADRPSRLRGSWANQTSDLQPEVFGAASRLTVVADHGDGDWHDLARRAVDAAQGDGSSCGPGPGPGPGPVHLDLGLDDPLVPDDLDWSPARRRAPRPAARGPVPEPVLLPAGLRTVCVAGDGAGPAARELAERAGWPLLAEPTSGSRGGPNRVGAYRHVVGRAGLGDAVQRVVVLGRPTLSRQVSDLLARPDVEFVHVAPPYVAGPGRPARRVASATPDGPGDRGWLASWLAAGARAEAAVSDLLDGAGEPTGMHVAREVARHTGDDTGLVVAASAGIRDLDLVAGGLHAAQALANRGLSGIDGTLSTASGVALGSDRRVRLLTGDLAFLHDLNGLLVGPTELRPAVQVVVVNDDGGSIFASLEHGQARFAGVHERYFATPHGVDLVVLCRAHGVAHVGVRTPAELAGTLAGWDGSPSVVEVRVDRLAARGTAARLAALAEG